MSPWQTRRLAMTAGLAVAVLSGALWAQEQRVELAVQNGHTRAVRAIAISSDGHVALTGSDDHTAILWETATGLTLRTLTGHSAGIVAVCLSGDGKLALTASQDETAILWDAVTGRKLHSFALSPKSREVVALSQDGKQVFTMSGEEEGTLWGAATGQKLKTLNLADPQYKAQRPAFSDAAFTPDGRQLLVGGHIAILWNTATGEKGATFVGDRHQVTQILFGSDSVAISGDGSRIVTAWEGEVIIWDGERKTRLHTHIFDTNMLKIRDVAISEDGKRVWAGVTDGRQEFPTRPRDNKVIEWDADSGRKLQELGGVEWRLTSVALSGNGSLVLAGSERSEAVLWNAAGGERLHTFAGNPGWGSSVAFSADGRRILTQPNANAATVWDAMSGQKAWILKEPAGSMTSTALSDDGKRLATGSRANTVNLWDVDTGKKLQAFVNPNDWIRSVGLNAEGSRVLAGTQDQLAIVWDASSGEKLHTLQGHDWPVTTASFSRDGKRVLTGSAQQPATVWDAESGRRIHAFPQQPFMVEGAIALSGDGQRLASAMDDKTLALWDATTGKLLKSFVGHSEWTHAIATNSDGSRILSGSDDKTAALWDSTTGVKLQTFTGHSHWVRAVALSTDGKRVLTGSDDGTTRLWDAVTGRELCQLYAFSDDTWAVIDPEGRFDAANGGDVEGLHWVADMEPIGLKQLKQRYYEPGLLAKAMGFNLQPLRPVSALKTVQLYPAGQIQPTKADETKLTLELTNRGGGIGRVQVLVNGKELLADARGERPDPGAKSAVLSIDLSGAPLLAGQPNEIEVVVWNADGYLASRALKRVYEGRGQVDLNPPELYAIVGGVSEYAVSALNLRFAAKDAASAARALELGAKRLFGDDRVHITLLTTDQPSAGRPTKQNFQAAFAAARRARPGDVLVVYLAGHGISLQRGADLYCFLTEEARATGSTDFADPAVLAQSTITSDELVDWIKQIPARKQVMLLDTCAAGAAAARLMEHRDLSGDQIRAIDRLKDRTGFHVLMGCAADRVSYEASQYSQGLLTYSLLQGMRGAALREEEYVDVSLLFQYAADQVPQLARNIGGIQKPLVMAPRGTSFDVGRLLSADKSAIPLALVKPLVLRPLLVNPDVGDDDLNLLPLLRRQFSAENYSSGRGEMSPALVYVDADELPGAIRPAGTYTVEGDKVLVKLNLRREGKTEATVTVTGSKNDLAELVARIVKELTAAIKRL